MRKVPVLASLAAVLALLAMPVGAETLFGTEPPDVILAPGSTADSAFDLNDFFDSTAGEISYEATGGSVDGSVASVFGLDNPGMTMATFTASDGQETLEVMSDVYVTNVAISGKPDINNNNRIAGVEGGNMFLNLLTPGSSASGSVSVSGFTPGGGGTPGGVTGEGVTGAGALIATIGSVSLETGPTGLRSRVATADVDAGASATMNADGTYEIATTDAFASAVVATLGAWAGDTGDAFHVVAAPATEVSLDGAVTVPAGDAPGTLEGNVVNVGPNQGLLVALGAVEVSGEYAEVEVHYSADNVDGLSIAAIGFDGALDGGVVTFANASGPANLESGKIVSVNVKVLSGSVIPAVQVFNGGSAAAAVTIEGIMVGEVRPLADYALNPNATADLVDPAGSGAVIDGSMADLTGWLADVNGQGAVAPVASEENNFAAAASGSVALNGEGSLSNATAMVMLGQGAAIAEAYVMAGDAGTFAMVLTSPTQNSVSTFKAASQLGDGWTKVSVGGTLSGDVASFLTIQAAGGNMMVDDVKVRVITDAANQFDANLLGG